MDNNYRNMILSNSNNWADSFVSSMSNLIRALGGYKDILSDSFHNRNLDKQLFETKERYSNWFYGYVVALSQLDKSINPLDESNRFDDILGSNLDDFRFYLRSDHFDVNDLPNTVNYLTILVYDICFPEVNQ